MKMRALFVGVLLCTCVGTASASEQDIQRAYEAALKCFVANGHVQATFKESGDAANARLFNERAEKSFKLAYFWGDMLHLSQQQIKHDLDQTEDTELRKLLTDSGYLTVVAMDCKHWGMM